MLIPSLRTRFNAAGAALAAGMLCLAIAAPAAAALQQVASVTSPGHTAYVNRNDPNDVILLFNNPDSAWGERTRLTATIVHDGFLQSTSYGLDHMALSVRGASMESVLPYLGYASSSPTYFGLGEQIGSSAPWSAVSKVISGRGPTLWPAGTPLCGNTAQPCLIFENYTVNLNGPGLICQGSSPCGYAVPVPVTTAPFQITVTADDWDVRTIVSQNGRTLVNVSCRAMTNNDARCGAQSGDHADGDAFIGNVVRNTGSGSTGRRLGATNIGVTVLRETYDCYPYICQTP